MRVTARDGRTLVEVAGLDRSTAGEGLEEEVRRLVEVLARGGPDGPDGGRDPGTGDGPAAGGDTDLDTGRGAPAQVGGDTEVER